MKTTTMIGLAIVIIALGAQSLQLNSKVKQLEEDQLKKDSTIMILTEENQYLDSTYCANYLYPLDDQYVVEVTGTKYQPVEAQTDATPFNTADGSFIEAEKLKNGELRWCALSQDLLWYRGGRFRYGDSLYVHSEQKAIKGWWIVHDCMNSRYTNRIDFLQWFDDEISGQNPNLLISNKIIGNERRQENN